MSVVEAIILGIVQGLSEFFPISSSAHLEITRWLLGVDELSAELETSFDVAVHLGTLVGAIAYLRADIGRCVGGVISSFQTRQLTSDGRIGWLIGLSALPAGAFGVLLGAWRESINSIGAIAIILMAFGMLLWFADKLPEKRSQEEFGIRDAVLMGFAQVLALVPGVSRSGVTITMARYLEFQREAAARLAFLMSLPVIAGAGVVGLVGGLSGEAVPSSFWLPLVCGVVASGVTGCVAVWGTLKLVRRVSLTPFVVYRLLLGLAVLGLLLTSWP